MYALHSLFLSFASLLAAAAVRCLARRPFFLLGTAWPGNAVLDGMIFNGHKTETRDRQNSQSGSETQLPAVFFFFIFLLLLFQWTLLFYFLLHRHVLDERSLKCGEVLLKCFSRPCFFFFVCYQGNCFWSLSWYKKEWSKQKKRLFCCGLNKSFVGDFSRLTPILLN